MSKKKNKNNGAQDREDFQVKYPMDLPQKTNMDDIGYMLDEAINDKLNRLEHDRSRLIDLKFDPKPWEIEIAYFRREQQLRKIRLEMHQNYTQKFGHIYDDQNFDSREVNPENLN